MKFATCYMSAFVKEPMGSKYGLHYTYPLLHSFFVCPKMQTADCTHTAKCPNNNVAMEPEPIRLLLLLCGFPVTETQVTASCIAQCGQKSKELKE